MQHRTRIMGYWYTVEVDDDGHISLYPIGLGTMANSRVDTDSYSYTHGGEVYRAAVDKARQLYSELQRKSGGLLE